MYKIFDTLNDFYAWQGRNGAPAIGTVNRALGFSDNNPLKTYRYSYPHPHLSATYSTDAMGMPTNIRGADKRVCCKVDSMCPADLVPDGLIDAEQAAQEGFFEQSEVI